MQYGYYISDLFLDDLHAIRYSTTQPVTEDLTLYCELSPKHYMVSFYSLEKLIDQQEVVYDDTVNLPSLADRKDYVFKYWATSKNGVAFSKNAPIHEDLNLYAVWQIHLSFSSFLLKVFFPIICVALFSYLLYWNTRKRKLEEESNIATLKQQKQQYIEERTTLEKVVNSLKKEKSQISKDIEKLKGIPSSENLVKKLDSEVLSLKMHKQDLIEEHTTLEKVVCSLKKEKSQISKDIEKLKGIPSSETYLHKLEADIRFKEKEKQEFLEKIEQLKQQENSLQNQISELKLLYGKLKDQNVDNEKLFKNASRLVFVFSHVTKLVTEEHYAKLYPGDSEYETTWYVAIYNSRGYSKKQALDNMK